MVASYSEPLAEKFSNDTREVMGSTFFRTVFPNTKLAKNTRFQLETSQRGGRFATSVGAGVTGFGASWIIIDDPHNASETYSPSAREAVKRYYGTALRTRLNDQITGRIILVMQRLHEDDLAGHLLAQGGWEHLKLPAIAVEDTPYELGRGKIHRFNAGELLHSRRLPLALLDEIRRDMGSAAFQAQYQQEPVPADGNMIKRAWLRYEDGVLDLSSGPIILSLDTATKTDPIHDYSVCTVWLEREGSHHLIHVWRDKVDYPALRKTILNLATVHHAQHLLIEDQGAGTSLVQELNQLGLPAIARKARDSKVARLAAASSYIEAGQMRLPKEAPWLAEFEAELLGFPGARHDDQVDSLSQYFGWVRERPRGHFSYDMMWDDDPSKHDILAEHLLWFRGQ